LPTSTSSIVPGKSFENGCRKPVLQVLVDGPNVDFEKGHQLLCQPNRVVGHSNFNAVLTALTGENEDLGRAVADLEFLFVAHESLARAQARPAPSLLGRGLGD
jgi:hypothetical protein